MNKQFKVGARFGLVAALVLLAAAPGFGAGFGIFEHGSRAMGMAGAFTAQADDPSALFHNVGGLAFLDKREFAFGATWITSTEADFSGANPFPGTGATGEQEKLSEFPAHFYFVQPINDRLRFGFGLNTPFGLTTEWQDPATWSGRYLSTKAALRTFDLNPSIGWQATPTLGLGLGLIYRFSDVELNSFVPSFNPFTQSVVDVGKVNLQSDLDAGWGWNVGLLHKYNSSFSWGFSYRSEVELDYGGDARFTQILTGNATFDAIVASLIPFNQDLPVETGINFPAMASLGFSFAVSPAWRFEVDANWTGWSSFDEVVLTFPQDPEFNDVIPEDWDDAYNYRLGVRWTRSASSEWRFGYVFDESPQPDTSVSPLLPDADRNGFTVGYGHQGSRFSFDTALMYLPFDERTTSTNNDNFNGTYNTTAYLLGVTLGW